MIIRLWWLTDSFFVEKTLLNIVWLSFTVIWTRKRVFAHPRVVPNLYDFVLWNTKIYILKNAGNQTVSVPIEFHYILKHTVEINGNRNCLVTNILQNIFFCIPQKKFRLRTAWGWVYEDSIFIFGWTIPFMRHILTQLVRYFTICALLYHFICFSKTRFE